MHCFPSGKPHCVINCNDIGKPKSQPLFNLYCFLLFPAMSASILSFTFIFLRQCRNRHNHCCVKLYIVEILHKMKLPQWHRGANGHLGTMPLRRCRFPPSSCHAQQFLKDSLKQANIATNNLVQHPFLQDTELRTKQTQAFIHLGTILRK